MQIIERRTASGNSRGKRQRRPTRPTHNGVWSIECALCAAQEGWDFSGPQGLSLGNSKGSGGRSRLAQYCQRFHNFRRRPIYEHPVPSNFPCERNILVLRCYGDSALNLTSRRRDGDKERRAIQDPAFRIRSMRATNWLRLPLSRRGAFRRAARRPLPQRGVTVTVHLI